MGPRPGAYLSWRFEVVEVAMLVGSVVVTMVPTKRPMLLEAVLKIR